MKKKTTNLSKTTLDYRYEDRKETLRELTSHANHLVVALQKKDYPRALFHANNARGCLNWLTNELTRNYNG